MSVNASLKALPRHRLPRQYADQVEGAVGKRSDWVWTMGEGAFANGRFAASLQLNCTEEAKGLVEPDSRVLHANFQKALADTKMSWTIVKPI
jgi:hypothetical protein